MTKPPLSDTGPIVAYPPPSHELYYSENEIQDGGLFVKKVLIVEDERPMAEAISLSDAAARMIRPHQVFSRSK